MKTTLFAQETPLHKVFSDDYLFTIPSVQRPYSWTTNEAGELLDDLLDFIEHYGITEKNIGDVEEPYFLGSIVLVKKDGPHAEVLDGQQRLTTLTILLAVLRDYLGDDYAAEIDDMIVQRGSKIRNIADTYRLCLRNRDSDFFKVSIQERGATQKLNADTPVKTDSQKAIRDNALYFLERLNELDPHTVKTLPGVIATLCYIVVVSTPNFDSAFRIFTVLNDRGLDLMTSDIFKAQVIGDIPKHEQDHYTSKWEDVEVSLGRDRFNKLFDHMRMIIQKRKGSANYKDEYNEIFSTISGSRFIDEYLIPYGEIYLKLVNYNSFFSQQPQLIKILSLLNRIDNNDWIPPAMYYMRHHNQKVEDFLYRLEVLAGTSMILRKNFNWRMSRYSQILREMDKGVDMFSDESALEVTEEDKQEVIRMLNGDVYTDLKDTAKRYLLLRLDSLLTAGQPYYDYSVITVEHVLPQTPKPNSDWLQHFPNPSEYVHKLGNLVLLTRAKNAQAKNYDFQKKKASYFQTSNGISSFALTTQVIQEKEWTPDVLKKRQKKLIDLLKNAWNLHAKSTTTRP
ncbi:DUF262 domain-containing protein [Brevibacillus agri]|uniref:DUF262 domain-containing protein n=1 Tax=Brevibacillus agri TaxID=51101 RepID=UPI001C8ED1A4|nr:DUF262 domain-containing protein [Brevibacillus agri]MBY0053380.1 DUF262 domain-containing protein [Brevibacillus agri]MED1822290.1 DUF262 domain-containing HNH endonuclease family protein [Brevibacillus agri]